MADFLSPEWVETVAGLHPLLPDAPGAEGAVTLSFAVAPRRELALHWVYSGGKVTSGGGGAAADAAATFTLAPADAEEVVGGRVEPSVAFMRGRLKAAGDGGLILRVLRSTADGGMERWRAQAAASAGW